MHAARGTLLALGIGLWCVGLQLLPFASAVVVNNTMPFFKMFFARVLLGENVGKERWLASIGGFIGCLIVFNPTAATFKPQSLFLILSAMCFAMLDIMNKKWSDSEPLVSTLFYGSVATALLSAPLALKSWTALSTPQLGLFALLGCGANLLLFCLIRSFRYVDASATCPYRYTEFVLSAIAGFLIFGEKPLASTLLGSCIILPSVVWCALIETRKN
jgi:drug/metabolite transporter (DMT)-like permease